MKNWLASHFDAVAKLSPQSPEGERARALAREIREMKPGNMLTIQLVEGDADEVSQTPQTPQCA